MKIGDTRPVSTTSSSTQRERGRAGEAGGVGAGRLVSDSASIMGIPEAEITPAVRDALMALMGEVDRLRRDMTAMQDRLREAEQLADRDPLIPALNRRAFVRELSRVIAFGRRYGEPAGLVYFDIDNFKQVNDRHGHAAGDAIGVILARADEATAKAKAAALAKLVAERPLKFEDKELPLSISVGAVAFTGEDEAADALARADKAMYEAKRGEE